MVGILSVLAAALLGSVATADVVLIRSVDSAAGGYFSSPSTSDPDHRLGRRAPDGSKQEIITDTDVYPKNFLLSDYLRDAQSGCAGKIRTMDRSNISDSGIAACYNVPIFDKRRGVFEAELRMYNMTVPTGVWKGVRGANMSLSLQYLNATMQPIPFLTGLYNTTMLDSSSQKGLSSSKPANPLSPSSSTTGRTAVRRRDYDELDFDLDGYYPIAGPHDGPMRLFVRELVTNSSAPIPREMKTYSCLGMLNPGVNVTALSMADLAEMMVPEVTLMAKDPSGSPIMTILSTKSTSFVAGAFQHAPAAKTAVEPKEPGPFVLPGVTLGIFPLGLIVTGTWVVVLVGAVGIGTIARIDYRNKFMIKVSEKSRRARSSL